MIAAIWARVSSPAQEEPSLDRQAAEVKAWLESQGWQVPEDKVLKVVWSSKHILKCPEMQLLLSWVRDKQVSAVGMTNLDRLSGKPAHMVQIFETLKESHCQLLAKETPLPDGLMAEMMAMLLAMAKALQVDKADTGAKKGLADRAIRRGLAPTMRAPYGYEWEGETLLKPDVNYQNAKLIWSLALQGYSLNAIGRELELRGILSPRGKPVFPPGTIREILRNPAYAGRPAALRYEVKAPQVRRVIRDGNTSARRKPMEEWVWLTNVKVQCPIVSWEEYQYVQERLTRNKALAKRNAKHDFLLRGLIVCANDGRKYYGAARKNTFPIYVCNNAHGKGYPGKCNSKPIPCRAIEADVKEKVRRVLEKPEYFFPEAQKRQNVLTETVEALNRDLAHWQKQLRDCINYECVLARLLAQGKLSAEAYEQEWQLNSERRKYANEKILNLKEKLTNLRQKQVKAETIAHLGERLKENLDRATEADWRFIFDALGLVVWAFEDGTWDIEINIPADATIVAKSP